MERSDAVAQGWLSFCQGVTNSEVERFDDIVSQEAHLVIGTAPGEMVTDRAQMRFGFETEGVSIESRSVQGFEEGTIGWITDEPRFGFPDGSAFDCRVTAVLRREQNAWKIVHAHFSVGVPDEEVVSLQQRWQAG